MASWPADQSPRPLQGPWEGDSKIVIGIDVGSTQSGVAFAFLQQGANQAIHRVTQWPGQEAQNQQSKIPTLVWYDSDKKAVSFGAEALSHTAEINAEDNGWTLAKYFKLHLHPKNLQSKHRLTLDPLPPGVSLHQIYADFLGYLLKHTKSFFEDRILDGEQIWTRYQSKMKVVIAHPNGWGLREQTFLREAAVEAGFADGASARANIRFVTEAEASVHFCIYHTNLGERLQTGMNFVVCDAGGSTVDTTVYSVASARPVLKLKEKRASACVQAGAIFVDVDAEKYLRAVFCNAQLSSDDVDEYTKSGIKDFEGFAKRAFRDATEEHRITIGSVRFNNSALNTRRGRMTLPGSTIKSLFNLCTEEIVTSVDQQIKDLNISYILLVGGFGDSPYLRREFKDRYEPKGSQVTLTNDSTSKAVADGAVIWSTLSNVFSRVLRASFGSLLMEPYMPFDPEHQGRPVITAPDGTKRVEGTWSPIVSKGMALNVEATRRDTYYKAYDSATPDMSDFDVELFSYSGDDEPEWGINKEGKVSSGELLPGFDMVCVIKADLSHLSGALQQYAGINGVTYWSMSFDICIHFGGTELEAFLEWKEKGVVRTGPVTIIPESVL
ncbi:hypothetical protein BDV93DRAFT_488628 [Ceratobasidium sp. AG-I]|nr:hypothetical protein BDV93DRAFT_488628 [Ceratobasidium sp. AG-I]